MSKSSCPDCLARPGSGKCDAHRKYSRMGDLNPKKPCPKCKTGRCSVQASQCLACFQKTRPAPQWPQKPRVRQEKVTVRVTPPSQIPDSRNPKPHRDWNTRMQREFAPKRPAKPVVIQDGSSGGEHAFPKRERVVVSRAVQGGTVMW